MKRAYQICTRCAMDTSDSLIKFDDKGVCDHCHNFDNNILPNWHTDEQGQRQLDAIVDEIKAYGKGKKYDCIIGLSGGIDSSYLAYYAIKKLGLRPLLYSVDTGWNLPVAVENTQKIVKTLRAEDYFIEEVVNFDELADLQRAYFKAQVPYQDTPQDHVIFAALYNYAVKQGIKYVLTGGNYSTECVREPNEWVYWNDLRQIKDIHKRFGTIPLKTLPMCSMFKHRLYYRYFKGMKIIKPLNLITYYKEDAIKTLKQEFDWQPYKNKHYESRFTRFYEGYWLPKKFGYDKRRAHFSSLILTCQMDRGTALNTLAEPPYDEMLAMEDMVFICNKLGFTVDEFKDLMAQPNKTFKDYKNTYEIINLAIKVARLFGIERMQYR
ncbi:MAG: N-acetyl sugar amidotransferase [Christensenellaceae bacterium]|nr:N-acetyl sugar amidotransferase [Christensenellaceae bacterium]